MRSRSGTKLVSQVSLPWRTRFDTAFAGEIFLLAEAIVEVEIIVEDEFLVVEEIEHHRQVGRADENRALDAAAS